MVKYILTFLAVMGFALSASASSTTVFDFGEAEYQLLMTTQLMTITTAEHCMSFYQDVTASTVSQVCDVDLVNEVVWPQNAQLRELRVTPKVAGDATYACEFTIEIGGVAQQAVTTTATATLNTVEVLEFNVNLADGELVGIMVGQGTVCGSGTDPQYIVEMWGRWVGDDAF
jgi:hypothetical protein